MSRSWLLLGSLALCTLLPFSIGCGPKARAPVTEEHDHNHGHNHSHGDHGEGPNGGHILEVGDADDHHLEWLHDDKANKVTFILLDAKLKGDAPQAMEALPITVVVAGKPPKEFSIPAENLKGGKASRFTIVDEALLVALEIGKGVSAKVKIGEKEHNVVIEHKEHDHAHDHAHDHDKEKK